MHDFAAHKTMTTFAQPASTPMVLVVEDEPAIAGVLSAYLERDGLRIRMAQDGEEALQSFRQLRPDLVLLTFICPRSMEWMCCA
jgi:two-component system response regulator AdeR